MQIVKRLAHALLIVLTLVIGAAAAAIIVSQTAWFKNWVRAYIVREANLYLNGTLSIERLSGNLLFGIEMENIDVSMDGQQIAAVKDIGLDYNVWDFISKGLSVDNLRLDKPVIYLRRDGDTWTLSRLVKKQENEADRLGPARPITIGDIGISDGSFVIDDQPVGTSGVDVPSRIDHVDAKLAFRYEPVHYSIDITHVSFRGSDPAVALNALSGSVAVHDDAVYVEKLAIRTAETSATVNGAIQQYLTKPVFNIEISSDKLSVPELARLFPALRGLRLQPQIDAKIGGPTDRLGVEMNIVSSAGRLHAKGVANVAGPTQSVTGDLSVRHLDLSAILDDPKQKSDITADGTIDLRGQSLADMRSLRGTVAIDAPRIAAAGYEAERVHGRARVDGRRVAVDVRGAAYGATATARGRVTIPEGKEGIAVDLRGRAQHVDLRRLPRNASVPRAATDVNADYHLVSSVGSASTSPTQLELRFEPSTIAGTRIDRGGTASASLGKGPLAYTVDADVAELDLQRLGREFDIPALSADRFKSTIAGHVTASGHGASLDDLDLTARGNLTNASVLGGRLSNVSFEAAVANDTAQVKASGQFADVNPAEISGRPDLEGRVGGAMQIDATLAHVSQGVSLDSVEGAATATLEPSTINGVEIAKANVDASYRNSVADIRSLEITGPDVNVQAKGTLALSESGSSNLTVHADSSNLEGVGKIIEQPLTGIGTVDATVTGNGQALEAKGQLVGNGVKYGNAEALTIAGNFTAQVPHRSLAEATINSDAHATFVSIGGQNINQIDGTIGYQNQQLQFDLTAKQPERSLGAAGSMIVHPDHHELHLQKLGLQTAGQTWQLAAGTSPTITYAPEAVTVHDLRLVSGDQTLAADGTYGNPGDELKITASNVDVATVDALLLREPQLTGRLNATASVHAAANQASASSSVGQKLEKLPEVDAEFQIAKGGFRQFRYDSFGGTVQYRGKGLTVDTKLEQSPTTFITAKGYVPTAIFSPAPQAEREAAHDAPVAPEDRVDLHVESTPIDLGLVQGFTTELTNVSGTLQAKLDVVGSASDPHPAGLITLQKGAFTVKATGVPYTDVEGKIELEPDRVRVGAISALDNHLNPITISGDLAVHERDVGDVQIYIHTDDFKVIDNKAGNLRVNTDLQIGGELRSPRIVGNLGITTGTINLDELLARIAESPYATTQAEYAPRAEQPPVPGSLDLMKSLAALSANVHITVPDDLVVKAADLQAPGSPVGLGALTAILGGNLTATKEATGELTLVGKINTVRGTFAFQGRRFDILRDGFVQFTGEPLSELNPTLDISTQRVVRAVEAHVNVRGTLRQPEIVLSSTPPLEQADILALILFNQPANMLGETQQISLVQQAQNLAGSSLTNALSQSIAEALKLTEFEINLAPEAGTGPEVRVGQQVGPNLYVRLEQGLGDQSQTNIVLEYELQKWLRLQTNVQQGSTAPTLLFQRVQGTGVDLLFFFSY
jgi:autotransporter translocation and assembly factor TamB